MRKFCAFELNKTLFGIDVQKVVGVLQNKNYIRVPFSNKIVKGLTQHNGQIVTILDLRKRLNMPERENEMARNFALVKTKDSNIVGLIIDEAKEIIEISSDTKVESNKNIKEIDTFFIYQTFKINDGLLIILDLDKIVDVKSEIIT